jgi:hypothetical protein
LSGDRDSVAVGVTVSVLSADAVGELEAETDDETVVGGDAEVSPVPVTDDDPVPEMELVVDASAEALLTIDSDWVAVVVPDTLGVTSALREPAGDAEFAALIELTGVDEGERVMSGDDVTEVERERTDVVVAVGAPDAELLGVLVGEETDDGDGIPVTDTFAESVPSGDAVPSGDNVKAVVSERLPVTEKLCAPLLERVGVTDFEYVGLAELVISGDADTVDDTDDATLSEAAPELLDSADCVDDGDTNADAEKVGDTVSLPVLAADPVAENVMTPLAVSRADSVPLPVAETNADADTAGEAESRLDELGDAVTEGERTPEMEGSIEGDGEPLLVMSTDADAAPEPDAPGDGDDTPLALATLGDADGEPLCDRLRSGLPVIETDAVPLREPPPETVGEFVIDDDPDTDAVAPRLALVLGVMPRDADAPLDADLRALVDNWGVPLVVCVPEGVAVEFADAVESRVEIELALVVNDARATVAEALCEADAEDCVVADAPLDGVTTPDTEGAGEPLEDPLLLGLPDMRALADDDADTQRETADDGETDGDGEFLVDTVCVAVMRGLWVTVPLPLLVEDGDKVTADEALLTGVEVTTGDAELDAVVD